MISATTTRIWARSIATGALMVTSSALMLTGCGGSKPADQPLPGASTNGKPAMAPDAGAAKDQSILKETAGEKNPDAGGGK